MIWFTSDLHLGHRAMLGFCSRPWETVEQMNAALVASINERVGLRDDLYVLGDFSYRVVVEAMRLREAISFRNAPLAPGNHDRSWDALGREGTFVVEPLIAQLKLPGDGAPLLPHERTDCFGYTIIKTFV